VNEARKLHADRANAENGHSQPLQAVCAEFMFHRRLHAAPDAARREGRWIPPDAFILHARRIFGDRADHLQIGFGDAGIFRRVVKPFQAIDGAAESLQQLRRFILFRIGENHGLAAAERNAAQRIFERHPAGEVFHIFKPGFETVVRVNPAAAAARPERRVMNGDDGVEPRARVSETNYLAPAIDRQDL